MIESKARPENRSRSAALWVSLAYGVAGALWIVFSDRVLLALIIDPVQLAEYQTYKGWLFIAVTAVFLYLLLRFHTAFAQQHLARHLGRANRWQLRGQLPLLVLAITMPVAGLLAYTYYSEAADRYRLAGAAVLNLAEVTAADSEKFIADTRGALTQLAARPQIRAFDRKRCDPALNDIPRLLSRLANIVVLDRTGDVICTAVPQRFGQPTSVAAIPWFRRLSQENRFVVGPPAVGFITGRWIVTLAHPLRDEQGAFIGAIVMPVDLARYEILTSRAHLSQGAVITLLDSAGTVVARSPEPEQWVGKNLRGTGIVDTVLAQRQGISEAPSSTGIWRVFGFTPVAGTDWYAVAQVPSDVVYADVRAALLRNIAAGLAVVLIVAVFVSVLMSRMFDARAEIEAELRESEQRYRLLVDESPYAIGVHQDGKIVFINPAGVRLFGALSAAELIGTPIRDRVAAEGWDSARDRMARMLTGESGLYPTEERYVRLDGSLVDVDVTAAPFTLAGRPAVQVIALDIAERKRAEEMLREQGELLREMSMMAHIGAWSFDPATGHGTWTDEAARIHGVDTARESNIAFGLSFFHGEQRERIENAVHEAIEMGKPYDLELELVTAQGERKWVRTIGVPVNRGGRVVKVRGSIQDITARKQAEAIHTQLAAIVQSSKEAIIGVTPDGAIMSWNPGAETVYAYRAEEMIGRHISLLAPPERQAESAALLDRIARGEAVTNHETERMRKDGTRIDVSLTLSPIKDEAGNTTGASTIARDITEKVRAERALRRVNRTLMMLSSCNEALVRAASEQQLLDDICRAIAEVGGYQLAWVGYAQESPDRTVSVAARAGTTSAYLDGLRFAWDDSPDGRGPTGTAIRRGERTYINDFATERRAGDWCRRAGELGLRSCIALPLAGKGRVVGALTLCSESPVILTDEEIGLLDELAADLAYGILSLRAGGERDAALAGHRASMEQARKALEDAIQAIATAAEMRDAYTAGHQRRVADLSAAIAQEMDLPEEQIHGLHLAGVVHDIGKIQVPAEILSKPTRLTEIEYLLIKTHSQAGYDILKGIDFPWPIALIVLQHHERLDGTGYPQGLKGEQILVEARIMAVADTVEAMASHRPYRPGLGIDKALDEITKNRGKLYDPGAVDACVRLFKEKGFAFAQ